VNGIYDLLGYDYYVKLVGENVRTVDRNTKHLTFQSLTVTLHMNRFNFKKFYVVPTFRLCVLYESQNKQQLLPYKTLRDWFL
jgi:hypothetical protein